MSGTAGDGTMGIGDKFFTTAMAGQHRLLNPWENPLSVPKGLL
jgi:hypothetical protein